jgi:hypothetical protein
MQIYEIFIDVIIRMSSPAINTLCFMEKDFFMFYAILNILNLCEHQSLIYKKW